MVNIFLGKNSDDCLQSLFEDLKKKYNINSKFVFLVPDRMSVICEKMIFEILEIESTCNIEVLTLSRLASRILKDKAAIKKTASCMILQKILKENKEKLKCFNKNQDSDLAQSIFGTISQFKSCKISFDEVVVKDTNQLLADKLEDISLLYNQYQKYLAKNNLIDSLDKQNALESYIKDSDFVKNSTFYVSNFDSLTFQGYQIIYQISKCCKDFSMAITDGYESVNSHIYNEKFSKNILELLKPDNIYLCNQTKQNQFKFLQDNLFCLSLNSLKINKSCVNLFEGKNFEEELIFCASTIKDYIVNKNYKFDDFCVAIPQLASKESIIKKVFNEYDFRYFLDLSYDFSKTLLPIFINNIYELYQSNFSIKNILSVVKSPLFCLEREVLDDFEDYILKFNIDDFYKLKTFSINDNFYTNFDYVRNYFLSTLNNFYLRVQNCKTYKDFILSYNTLFIDIELEKRLSEFIERLSKSNNLKQVKIFEQFLPTINEMFEELDRVLGKEECDFKTFISSLNSGISACKISTTPLSINSIFVGDCSTSFFENKKIMFILNACEEEFPNVVLDCGIISDEDIKSVSSRYKLEPSIADINKKERFKVFELIIKPSEALYLSYNYDNKTMSKIFDDISKMFTIEQNSLFFPIKIQRFCDIDFLKKNNSYKIAKNNLIYSLRSFFDGQKDIEKFDDYLYFALKDNLPSDFLNNFNFLNRKKLKNNIFLKNNSTSVSQIECYMSCPFLHFIRYGLKLNDKERGEFKSLEIGNILHKVAYELLKNYSLPLEKEKLKIIANNVFDKIINLEVFSSLRYNNKNKVLINNLKKESMRFVLALNEQAIKSKFVPTYFEIPFSSINKSNSFNFKVLDKNFSLNGQVDRIDIYKNYFRVIDYKTGKCDTSYQELFFGKKIQLEAYLKFISTTLRLKPAGAYYLPIKNSFSDAKTSLQAKYQLKGRTLNDDEIIDASDCGFANKELKSDIVEVKFKQNDDDRVMSAFSKVYTKQQIEDVSTYAINLIKKACQDILNLDITPSPLMLGGDDICKNCKFFALCKFDRKFGNVYRKPDIKVDISFFDKKD